MTQKTQETYFGLDFAGRVQSLACKRGYVAQTVTRGSTDARTQTHTFRLVRLKGDKWQTSQMFLNVLPSTAAAGIIIVNGTKAGARRGRNAGGGITELGGTCAVCGRRHV